MMNDDEDDDKRRQRTNLSIAIPLGIAILAAVRRNSQDKGLS